jgi:hypothetical protein
LLLENAQFNGVRNNEKSTASTALILGFAFTTLSPVAHANGTTDQLLSPVTGKVLPEGEQALNGVPGGAAVVQLLNTGI